MIREDRKVETTYCLACGFFVRLCHFLMYRIVMNIKNDSNKPKRDNWLFSLSYSSHIDLPPLLLLAISL